MYVKNKIIFTSCEQLKNIHHFNLFKGEHSVILILDNRIKLLVRIMFTAFNPN